MSKGSRFIGQGNPRKARFPVRGKKPGQRRCLRIKQTYVYKYRGKPREKGTQEVAFVPYFPTDNQGFAQYEILTQASEAFATRGRGALTPCLFCRSQFRRRNQGSYQTARGSVTVQHCSRCCLIFATYNWRHLWETKEIPQKNDHGGSRSSHTAH